MIFSLESAVNTTESVTNVTERTIITKSINSTNTVNITATTTTNITSTPTVSTTTKAADSHNSAVANRASPYCRCSIYSRHAPCLCLMYVCTSLVEQMFQTIVFIIHAH